MISLPLPVSLKGSEKRIIKAVDRLNITRSENVSFIDQSLLKVAAVPIKLKTYKRLDDYVAHVFEKTGLAVRAGAQLVCLPELIGLAPLLMVPKYEHILAEYKLCTPTQRGDYINNVLYDHYEFIQEVYFATFSELACQYGIYVLAGSLYLFEGEGLFNRSYLFDPDGDVIAYQDKLHLTKDEVSIGITAGKSLTLMNTKVGNLCVAIGQDNSYFEVYRIAKGIGAQIVLSPTCNLNYGIRDPDCADAYLRVQETPLYAVKACLSGSVLHRHFGGTGGIYAPVSLSEERQGILASTGNDLENPVVARVNLARVDSAVNTLCCDDNLAFSSAFARSHFGEAVVVPQIDLSAFEEVELDADVDLKY